MKNEEILLSTYRVLRPVVDTCRLNAIARPVWARLWTKKSGALIRAEQNGRAWRLDPEVALRGSEQEVETILWLRSVVKPGMTVIDVGANVGQMTLEMAHLVGEKGRVIAIEPGPGNLEVLRRHVDGNGFSERVTVIAAACCAKHGGSMDLDIPAQSENEVGSRFQLNGIGIGKNPLSVGCPTIKLKVATVSLDGIIEDLRLHPLVLKIDVEGAELEVLRGARNLLHSCQPDMSVGFHPFAFEQPSFAQSEIIAMLQKEGLTFGPSENEAWALGEYTATRRMVGGNP
jgi:FkbM family methyltransferase